MRESQWIGTLALAALLGGCQLQAPGGEPSGGAGESAPAAETREEVASAEAGETAAEPTRRGASGSQVDRAAPSREPEPAPTPAPVVVPEGSELILTLQGTYSSATNRVGDVVLASLADDVRVQGRVVLRAGTEVRGSVTGAARSGRAKGRARLALGFDRLRVDGRNHDISASGIDVTADGTRGRDAAIIGGSAGAGAVVGGIAKGGKGAAIGGLLGGAAGTAAVLTTRGDEVEFPAGSQVRIRLAAPLRLQP